MVVLIMTATAALYAGCSSGSCNNVPQRPLPPDSPTPSPFPGAVSWQGASGASAPSPTPTPLPAPTPTGPVSQVFKVTGERQCETGRGVPLEDVRAQLTSRRIPVYEAHTQADGLMHMALCGAPSGTIHVFTIPKAQEKRALRLGFKVFRPRP